VIRKRGGDGYLNDVRSERGYATGRWVLPTLTTLTVCLSSDPCCIT
jgi:hypothetical protein